MVSDLSDFTTARLQRVIDFLEEIWLEGDDARTAETGWFRLADAQQVAEALEALHEQAAQATRRLEYARTSLAFWCPHGMDSSRAAEYGTAREAKEWIDEAIALLAAGGGGAQ